MIHEITWIEERPLLLNQKSLQHDGNTNSPAMRQTLRQVHHRAQGAPGPYFLCQAPSQYSSSHNSSVCQRGFQEPGSLWGHVTMTSHSQQSVYCWSFRDVFTASIKTRARTQGPLYIKSINNNGSPALFKLDKENWMIPLSRNGTPFFFLEYTRYCPSRLLNIRFFQ